MLLTLPRSVAALVAFAAKGEQIRFGAVTNLLVEDQGNGLYRVVVTDGRRIAVAQGPFDPPPFRDPNQAVTSAFIPTDLWKDAFRAANFAGLVGATREQVTIKADADYADIVVGPKTVKCVLPGDPGRFPDWKRVYPGKPPKFSVKIDPAYLRDALQAAIGLTNDEARGVTLHFFAPQHGQDFSLVGISHEHQGHTLDCLVVPLVAAP